MVYAPLLNQKLNARNTAQNSGAAPAGSVVSYDVRDVTTLAVQVLSSSLSQSIYLQGSIDGKNWVTIGGNFFLNQGNTSFADRIPNGATGIFSANVAEYNFVRLTTPDVAVTGEAVFHINGGGEGAIVAFENPFVRVSPLSEADSLYVQNRRATSTSAPNSFVLAASTSTQIIAANTGRRGLLIVNRSGQEVFLRYGANAATANLFSWVLAANEKYEVPFDVTTAIQALSVAAGAAPGILVTEFTN